MNSQASSNYMNKIANAAILIIALLFAFNIFKNQQKAVEALKQAKDFELKRGEVLSRLGQLDKKISFYKKAVNRKEISSVLNNVTNIAKDSRVKVISLKPMREENFSEYSKYPFELTAHAQNYNAIGKFIGALENNSDIYVVDSVEIKPSRLEASDTEGPREYLVLNLKLSTILLK